LRGTLFTGFPWLTFGTSQAPASPLAGFAPLLGAYGTTLAMAAGAAMLVAALLASRAQVRVATLGGVVVIFLSGAGLRWIDWTRPDGAPISIALLQGNVPQQLKWEEDVRTRTLLGIDRAGIAGYGERLRRIYWQTASRGDYEELIPELTGSAAYGFLGGEKERRAEFRRAVADIPSLRKLPLWFFVPDDPALRQGALLLYANWRDLGLGPITLRSGSGPDVKVNAGIDRTIAAYAQVEAIPAELVLRGEVGSERLLLRALGAAQQRAPLELLDAQMRRRASAIPLAWVVDARLVSPRLEGWREDALGNVDYAEVRSLASSRSP